MIVGTDKSFKAEVLEAKGLVLVDFNADWCGPCQMMKPVVEEFGKENNVKIISINVDDYEEFSDSYGVYTIPCLVLFRDGKEIAREEGVVSPRKLKKMLEK